jgi:flavodoxin
MKFVIVYDSVSKTRMTEKVAGIVREGLKEKGIEAEMFHVKDVGMVKIENYDGLIVGSPTMAWKPTKEVTAFLDGLKGKKISGKMASCFDTQMKSFMSGNANKSMEDDLREMGFKIVNAPLLAYVHGGKDKYQLRDGETEKAKEWVKALADAAVK